MGNAKGCEKYRKRHLAHKTNIGTGKTRYWKSKKSLKKYEIY